jgi:hypothetical protein
MQQSEPAQQILRDAGLEIAFVAAANIARHLRGEAPNPDNLVR